MDFQVAPDPPGPTTDDLWRRWRSKCSSCGKYRMTMECVSCQERYCSQCGEFNERKEPQHEPCCGSCMDEARDYARYGYWGPP